MTSVLEQHKALVKACSKILGGANPMLQGSVTAELMAIYIAGFKPPEAREPILQLQIATIRELLPACVEEIHGRADG